MNTSVIAVALIFAVAFLVMGIEIAHQRMTTGVVNMKTARELGITFPTEILLQITEVVE